MTWRRDPPRFNPHPMWAFLLPFGVGLVVSVGVALWSVFAT